MGSTAGQFDNRSVWVSHKSSGNGLVDAGTQQASEIGEDQITIGGPVKRIHGLTLRKDLS